MNRLIWFGLDGIAGIKSNKAVFGLSATRTMATLLKLKQNEIFAKLVRTQRAHNIPNHIYGEKKTNEEEKPTRIKCNKIKHEMSGICVDSIRFN